MKGIDMLQFYCILLTGGTRLWKQYISGINLPCTFEYSAPIPACGLRSKQRASVIHCGISFLDESSLEGVVEESINNLIAKW